jgi:hypothetical protein
MPKRFTLDYWIDGGWYVGRLQEIPTVFSQGETLAELEKIFRMPTDSCSKSRPSTAATYVPSQSR